MEGVNYFEDSQYDSVMDFDSHMNPFVKESICSDAEDECKIVEDTYADDEEMVCDDRAVEKKVHSTAGNGSTNLGNMKDEVMMVDADSERVGVDKREIVVIDDDDNEEMVKESICSDAEDECKIVEDTYADDEEMVCDDRAVEKKVHSTAGNGSTNLGNLKDEVMMVDDDSERVGADKRKIVVIDDDDNEEEKGQTYVEGCSHPKVQKGDRDFDLNKLPLSGLLKFSDPSSEKRFIEIMRKYQSKYY